MGFSVQLLVYVGIEVLQDQKGLQVVSAHGSGPPFLWFACWRGSMSGSVVGSAATVVGGRAVPAGRLVVGGAVDGGTELLGGGGAAVVVGAMVVGGMVVGG